MADVLFNRGDGVIVMDATNSGPTVFAQIPKPVKYLIVTGATAGTFSVRLNNTTFDIITAAANLTIQVKIPLAVNEVELVAEPV